MSEDHTDSEPEDDKDRPNCKVTEPEDENEEGSDEDEDGTGSRRDENTDDDEDEDYEEVTVKPRPLNEVTSLTDRTSPWTSILSDPDLVCLESLEAPEEPNLSQGEYEKRLNLQPRDRSGKHKCDRREDGDSFSGSAGDASDTDGDDERTRHALNEGRVEEPSSPSEGSGDEYLSPTTQRVTDTHDASCSNQETLPQPYP